MGIERIEAALIIFCVVRMLFIGDVRAAQLIDYGYERRLLTYTFSYSQIAGRNFSWMSQILPRC